MALRLYVNNSPVLEVGEENIDILEETAADAMDVVLREDGVVDVYMYGRKVLEGYKPNIFVSSNGEEFDDIYLDFKEELWQELYWDRQIFGFGW